jgi:ABC-type transport system involved in multi-copper enzyme maturation permease subunit
MKNLIQTSFATIFQNEVRLNSKRVAPYAMAILFGGNALLWWGWGPAAGRGWATNSDAFIAGVLPVYSFMTLPLFTALIMADPVIRDFRTGVAPLIFSKPVSRAEYLLGKFFGNFFVLVCCQASFVLTLIVLQAFGRTGMIVQEMKLIPYLKHFLIFVVISHLVLAAFYFSVGTLTRNAKIVYGLGVAFYPLYIAYQIVFLKSMPLSWRGVLDPLLMNWRDKSTKGRSAEWVNQFVVAYDSDLIANRAMMILLAAICFAILYARFTIAERPGPLEKFSVLSLSTASEEVYYDSESSLAMRDDLIAKPRSSEKEVLRIIPIPKVAVANEGIRAHLNKLIAAMGVEFRLLRTERSLVVILPLAVLLSFLSLPFQAALSGETYSAGFASSSASGLLLFLLGVIVFYTGEGMHRDREAKIESVLWATPVPNSVLLLSKFLTTISLALVLIVMAGLTAIATQLLRGHTPVEFSAYLITYSVILFPTIVFMTAASIALNILLRDKYLAYAVSIATGGGLFYLYSHGYNHWLYNPALYQLWTYADLTGAGNNQLTILIHRIYCLAIGGVCLALAHLFFERRPTKGLTIGGRLRGNGWSILIMIISAAIALIVALVIYARTRL